MSVNNRAEKNHDKTKIKYNFAEKRVSGYQPETRKKNQERNSLSVSLLLWLFFEEVLCLYRRQNIAARWRAGARRENKLVSDVGPSGGSWETCEDKIPCFSRRAADQKEESHAARPFQVETFTPLKTFLTLFFSSPQNGVFVISTLRFAATAAVAGPAAHLVYLILRFLSLFPIDHSFLKEIDSAALVFNWSARHASLPSSPSSPLPSTPSPTPLFPFPPFPNRASPPRSHHRGTAS